MTEFNLGDKVVVRRAFSDRWNGVEGTVIEGRLNDGTVASIRWTGGSHYPFEEEYEIGDTLRFDSYKLDLLVPRLTEQQILKEYCID